VPCGGGSLEAAVRLGADSEDFRGAAVADVPSRKFKQVCHSVNLLTYIALFIALFGPDVNKIKALDKLRKACQ
jgi:hypothetical protein